MEISYSLPHFNHSVLVSKRQFLQAIDQCLNSIKDHKIAQSFETSYSPLFISDINRIICQLDFDNSIDNIWKSILFPTLMKCEKESTTSGIVCLITFLELLKTVNKKHGGFKYDENSHKELFEISSYSHYGSFSDYMDCLKGLFQDEITTDIMYNALRLVGAEGHIFVDKGSAHKTSIELVDGYCYKLKLPDNFLLSTNIKEKTWIKNDTKIMIVDGIIENVSEIHPVLEKLHEEKQPCIIFARGFADDVISTLAQNMNRQMLDVIPVIVPYDLEGVNQLKDLAVICGCDVRSSFKGELISTIRFEDLASIQKTIIEKNKIIIKNTLTKHNVGMHKRDLHHQLISTNPDCAAQYKFLINRIKSLSSQCVHIKISDSLMEKKWIIIDRLEMAIGCFGEIAKYGVIDLMDVFNNKRDLNYSSKSWMMPIITKMISMNLQKISIKSFHHGIRVAISLINEIKKCKTVILLDQNK